MINSKQKSFKPLNIRHENIKQVINLVKNSKNKLSRADISRNLSLSTPSISSIISVLIERDIIIETDDKSANNSVGRNPILLKLNQNCGYILGVLISEDMLTIALADYTGNIIKKHNFYYIENEKKCTDFLIESINELLDENNFDYSKLLSISISFPGVFDHQKQKIKFAPHSGAWQNEPLISKLTKEYDCEVRMENNVNIAVLGEKWRGKIGNKNNAVYLKLGNGIAAGILINKRLYRGYNSLAGEVGFSVTDSKHLKDKVTDSGSFEQRFNTDQILERIRKKLGDEKIKFSDLNELINENNELKEMVMEINQNISMLLINIISVLNAEVIVIGGQYSEVITIFLKDIENTINNNVPFAPEILVSDLDNDVYYLGAIANSLQNIENQLIKNYFME